MTNGSISSITVGINSGIVGTGYTSAAPPVVLIAPPTYVREENSIDLYEGDFGVITKVGIVTNLSDTTAPTGIGIGTGVVFDLYVPKDSPLRDAAINSPDAITRSGLQTGYYFTVSNSNIGSGVTAVSMTGSIGYVGVGTTALDGVYEVAHHVGITTIGIGTDQSEEATRVFCRVLGWNGLENTVGYSTVGQGHSTRYLGDFSWGRLQLNDRQVAQAYTVNTNNGVTGIKTGPQVKRKIALKAENFVV